jgi:hypothetical protein
VNHGVMVLNHLSVQMEIDMSVVTIAVVVCIVEVQVLGITRKIVCTMTTVVVS